MTKIHTETIQVVAAKIRLGKLSPVEVAQACLDRVARLNPTLNAFITVLVDEALEQSRHAEAEIRRGRWRGPLHGIPVAIKDFYDVAGAPATGGSGMLKDRIASSDAATVAALKHAGAIIIGKTNMDELGMGTTGLSSYFGPVRNPWDQKFVPGGSSAGSAVALATGMCFATFDTDAIGSTRLPAAVQGVVGFKGSYGLLDMAGILGDEQDPGEMIRWLAHGGLTARSVPDVAILLDAILGTPHYFDALNSQQALRLGIPRDTDVHDPAFQAALQVFESLGCDPSASVTIPHVDVTQGFDHIEADRKNIGDEMFANVDVIAMPTLAGPVPTVEHAQHDVQALSPQNTAFANFYGLPAITVPIGLGRDGLPFGLQLLAKPGDDAAALYAANQIEQATAWHQLSMV